MHRRTAAQSFWAILVFGISACTGPTAPGTPAVSDQVLNETGAVISAARRDYKIFLNRIPIGDEAAYGFKNRGEFDRVRIGVPLRVHTIDVDRSGPKPTVSDKIRPLDEWRVPLIVDDKQRALLTVVNGAEGFKTVDFGASGLADALNSLETTTPFEAGSAAYLLRLFDLRQDFLSVPNAAGERFYPAMPHKNTATSDLPLMSTSVPQGGSSAPYFDRNALMTFIQHRVKDGAP